MYLDFSTHLMEYKMAWSTANIYIAEKPSIGFTNLIQQIG
jgi:hypothetical protein